jgi:peptidoglycan/LPS O-acetylase OafA/YrhL
MMTPRQIESSANPGLTGRIPPLDGLRGCAILMVYVLHYFGGSQSHLQFVRTIVAIKEIGWIGVDLFFVLSGFLITTVLLDLRDSQHRWKIFYGRRALRILPLYYAVALVLFFLTPLIGAVWTAPHLAFLVYAQNVALWFNPHLAFPAPGINMGHFWSLAVEEQFYLFWPIIVWSVPRDKLTRTCLLIALGTVIARCLAPLGLGLLVFRWDGFCIGGCVAVTIQSGRSLDRRFRWLTTAGLVFIACIAATGSPQSGNRLMATLGILSVGVMFTGVLIAALQGGWVARMLSMPPLRFFGKYSYGLYVIHELWRPALVKLIPPNLAGQAIWFLGTLALNLTVAVASYHLFESRFYRLKDSRFPRHPNQAEALACAKPNQYTEAEQLLSRKAST